jgi:hypothetical protein
MRPLAKGALVGCGVFLILNGVNLIMYGVNLLMSEAPPTPPHIQSTTTSQPAHPIPLSDSQNSIPPSAPFANARELAGESPPGSPLSGIIPRIATAEVRDEEGALSKILEGTPALGTAQEHLARFRRRNERATEAYMAKEAAENRKENAVVMEWLLLEGGMGSHATGSLLRRLGKAASPASSRRTAGSRVATAVSGAAVAPNPVAVGPLPAATAAAVPAVAASPARIPMPPCGEDRPCCAPSVTVSSF